MGVLINTVAKGWHEVDREHAQRFVELKIKKSNMPQESVIDYINQNKLSGITVKQLLRGKKYD